MGLLQFKRLTSRTITLTFYSGTAPSDLDGGIGDLPDVTITRPDGTLIPPGTITRTGVGTFTFVLEGQPDATVLAVQATGTIGGEDQTLEHTVEIVGADLFGIVPFRAMRVAGGTPFAANAVPLITDAQIQETRAACLEEMQHFLSFSPVPRYAREVASGNGSGIIRLVHPGLEATEVVSVTVAGVVQLITGYTIDPGGWLEATSSYFPYGRRNVTVEYIHGWDRPRGLAGRAAMVWAAALLNPSGFSSATTVSLPTGESYTYEPAETGRGGYERFTGVRELDRWLNSHRARAAVA